MKVFLKNNSVFYIPYLLFVIIGSIVVLTTDKLVLHSQFNSLVGNSIIDSFFKYETHIGDGLFLVFVALVFFFFDLKKGLFLLVAYAVSGGFTQFLKEVFFNEDMRPFFYHSFYNFPLTVVDGVTMYSQNTFPSGHATSAFCLFFCLSFFSQKNWGKVALFLLALITGFSRVYLSQHFFKDVFVGSIIGVGFSSVLAYIFYASKFSTKFVFIERPIYKILKKENGQ